MMSKVQIVWIVLCVVGASIAWSSLSGTRQQANARQSDPAPSIRTGHVSMARLEAFCPDRLAEACNLLLVGKVQEAAPAFRQELINDPDSMPAYVGLSQADAGFRASELRRLQQLAARGQGRPQDKFKLGLQVFYQWEIRHWSESQSEGYAALNQSAVLLDTAWRQTQLPLAGEMAMEVYQAEGGHLEKQTVITRGMILELAGVRAYNVYQDAAKSAWQAPLPPAALVPQQNWKALRGVLAERWSFLSIGTSSFTVQDGKAVLGEEKHPTRNPGEADYIEHWREALARALQEGRQAKIQALDELGV